MSCKAHYAADRITLAEARKTITVPEAEQILSDLRFATCQAQALLNNLSGFPEPKKGE